MYYHVSVKWDNTLLVNVTLTIDRETIITHNCNTKDLFGVIRTQEIKSHIYNTLKTQLTWLEWLKSFHQKKNND